MTSNVKRAAAIGGAVVVVAAGAFFMLGDRSDIPLVGDVLEPPRCPLSGVEPRNEELIERPAVAVKIENNPAAYPLSGLEKADLVYEEPVEGGLTRFMAIYHCRDAAKAGPVRSARIVDPAIMSPVTRILGAAGGNEAVRSALDEGEIVIIDELSAGDAMTRVDRPGIASEHTLYANVGALRKLGRKSFDETPPDDLFVFGELEGRSKKARSITITFPAAQVGYEWSDEGWLRSDGGAPLTAETGSQIVVDNVIIEEHTINHSELTDVLGAASPEIEDVTGSGRAVLFRDGRAIVGRWRRESAEDPVTFETKSGDEMVLSEGTTWIELVPNDKGEVKGSFSYAK